jgi:hypothetical protein
MNASHVLGHAFKRKWGAGAKALISKDEGKAPMPSLQAENARLNGSDCSSASHDNPTEAFRPGTKRKTTAADVIERYVQPGPIVLTAKAVLQPGQCRSGIAMDTQPSWLLVFAGQSPLSGRASGSRNVATARRLSGTDRRRKTVSSSSGALPRASKPGRPPPIEGVSGHGVPASYFSAKNSQLGVGVFEAIGQSRLGAAIVELGVRFRGLNAVASLTRAPRITKAASCGVQRAPSRCKEKKQRIALPVELAMELEAQAGDVHPANGGEDAAIRCLAVLELSLRYPDTSLFIPEH